MHAPRVTVTARVACAATCTRHEEGVQRVDDARDDTQRRAVDKDTTGAP
jgi:hypothetical protein